jgi:hypothetical protein
VILPQSAADDAVAEWVRLRIHQQPERNSLSVSIHRFALRQ